MLGDTAGTNQYPWAVGVLALVPTGYFVRASATVISPHYVLTCGHCLPPEAKVDQNIF